MTAPVETLAADIRPQDIDAVFFDFDGVIAMAGPGAVVYCDPPYVPMSATANFTAYDGNRFTMADQERLASAFAGLARQGATGILSNSWTDETLELYARHGLYYGQVFCRRNINRNGAKRGPVPEIMVTTHPYNGDVEMPIAAHG